MLQKCLSESITGHFLESCLIDVCLFYLSISCFTDTEPKYFVSNGVLQPHTSVFNGVRQSTMLNSAGVGCHIHNCCTNHVYDADDLCIIAPRASGL